MPFLSEASRPGPAAARARRASGSSRDHAHDDGERAALAEHVDAEAAALGQRVRQIAGALLLERAQRRLVAADQIAGDARGVLGAEQRQLRHVDRRQLAMLLDLRRTARREHQVADPLAGIQHRDNQRCVEMAGGGAAAGLSAGTAGLADASLVMICRLTYWRPDELICRTQPDSSVRAYDAHVPAFAGRRLNSWPAPARSRRSARAFQGARRRRRIDAFMPARNKK